MEARFKDAMARWASSVGVLLSSYEGRVHGLTVTGFMSLSVSPPSVLVSIYEKSGAIDVIRGSKKFSFTVLREDQEDVSRVFAMPDPEKHKRADIIYMDGVPYLRGLATVFCRVSSEVKLYDHVLFVGDVYDVITEDGMPLIYFNRGYRSIRL